MRDKKDQLHAHLFMVGRLVGAVVLGEPDAHETPMRRSTNGAMAGMAITILIVAGLMVWALISPGGNTDWQTDGGLVVEKETATHYLYLDGVLHPTLNATSAALAVGGADNPPVASQASLEGVPRGTPVGIIGAPSSFPEADELLGDPWSICAVSSDATSTADGGVLVSIGDSLSDDASAQSVEGILVQASGAETRYLVVGGQRFLLDGPAVMSALGYDIVVPLTVDPSWINTLVPGPDIAVPEIFNQGEEGPEIAGRPGVIGQVFVVERIGLGLQYYVLFGDGLLPVSETVAAVLLGDPESVESYPGGSVAALEASASDVAAAPTSSVDELGLGWPTVPPTLQELTADDLPCVHIDGATEDDGDVTMSFRVHAAMPESVAVPAVSPGQNELAADLVNIAAGSGVLAFAQPNPGDDSGTPFLITEIGVKYPLASAEALSSLGYGDVDPLWLPGEVLDFLPTGPSLDPEAARTLLPVQPNPGLVLPDEPPPQP